MAIRRVKHDDSLEHVVLHAPLGAIRLFESTSPGWVVVEVEGPNEGKRARFAVALTELVGAVADYQTMLAERQQAKQQASVA